MEKITLEAISISLKDKKVAAGSQHVFMKEKSCLTPDSLLSRDDWLGG